MCGDVNIAPTDDDVFDPAAYVGQTHVTPPEREALAALQAVGLRDVVRERWPEERVFTYWDYRAGMFHQDLGMRIDLVLAGEKVADRVKAAWIDRQARKGKGPERSRTGDGRPRRGTRRRHRPDGATALGARDEARQPRSCRSRRRRRLLLGGRCPARAGPAWARPASSDSRAGRACRPPRPSRTCPAVAGASGPRRRSPRGDRRRRRSAPASSRP